MSFTITLSLGNRKRIGRYFVKDDLVSKYVLTLPNDNLLWVFNRFGFPNDAGPFKYSWSNVFFSEEVRPFLLFGLSFCRLFSCARFSLVGNLITAS